MNYTYARIYGDSTQWQMPKVTPEFEKFDPLYLKRIKYKNTGVGREILQDGTEILMKEFNSHKSYFEYHKDQYFYISKVYYPNGNIKEKGLYFLYGGFEKGVWYNFDEQGNLTDSIDHDEPYKFTFEQVLEFARKEGIEYRKFDVEYEILPPDTYTELYRFLDDYIKKSVWIIRHWNQKRRQLEEITIDGVTGEVLERQFTDFLPR